MGSGNRRPGKPELSVEDLVEAGQKIKASCLLKWVYEPSWLRHHQPVPVWRFGTISTSADEFFSGVDEKLIAVSASPAILPWPTETRDLILSLKGVLTKCISDCLQH